jgi:hypothetical protein
MVREILLFLITLNLIFLQFILSRVQNYTWSLKMRPILYISDIALQRFQ